MGNHFYGSGVEEHYEKEIKDFNALDWFVMIVFFGLIVAAIVLGVMAQWGVMVIVIGVDVIWLHFLIRLMFEAASKITPIFAVLGVITIIGGVVVLTGKSVFFFGIIVYILVSFFVGILFLNLAAKKKKKINTYSLTVEADCVTVDVRRVNLFHYDDIVKSNLMSPINNNMIYKPAFHYYVNGYEYFTESTVYYGDLNTGYMDGQRIWLRVNPNNPTDVLPRNENASMESIMGWFWLVMGIIVLAVVIILAALGQLSSLM